MSRTIAVLLTLGLLAVPTISLAQEPLLGSGLPPFDTLSNGAIDKVDAGSLNVHISIPALQKPGRGMPFNYVLSYDSTVWGLNSTKTAWQPAANWGWRGVSEAILGYVSYTHIANQPCTGYPNITVYENFAYHDPSGTMHSFYYYANGAGFSGLGSPACPNGLFPAQATLVTVDGSGYTITINNTPLVVSLYDRSGKLISPPLIDVTNGQPTSTNGAGSITDTNGNVISTNGSTFYDTMSATAPVLTVSGTNPVKYTYTGPNSTSQYVAANYQNFTVATNFGCSGYTEYPAKVVPLITSIVLADGSSYGFSYEKTPNQSGHYTGRISEITLPTGGNIQYSYIMDCPNTYYPPLNGALTRTLTPGGVWTYTGAATVQKVAIVDPAGNETDLTFILGGSDPYWHPYESYRQVYQGSSSTGTLLETITTCYNSGNVPSLSECADETQVTLPVVQIDSFRTPAAGTNAQSETRYTNYGLLTEDQEYDYGGAFISNKKVAYASPNAYILDRPACVQVTAGTGPATCGTVTSSTASLTNYSNYDSHGNAATISYWVSGSKYLSRNFTYYSTGLVKTIVDVNGSPGTYSYTYGDCNSSLPTTISEPLNLSVSMTWDCNGAVPLSTSDENQQPTTYAYDALWRTNDVKYPDGGETTTAYNTTANPPNVTVNQLVDSSGHWHTTQNNLDGLSRIMQQQLTSDPSGTDYVDTTYDAVGNVYSVSNPYRSQSDPTYGITYYNHDALGRTTLVKPPSGLTTTYTYNGRATKVIQYPNNNAFTKIYQSDGLGRLVDVCEVTGVTQANGKQAYSCGLDITATGFLSTLSYDPLGNLLGMGKDGQTRTMAYDGLSRPLSITTPEGGTTSYVYDTATAGDLYTETRPLPNGSSGTEVVTHTFDAMHRPLCSSYSDGTTPGLCLTYDQSTVPSTWGNTSLANGKGRVSWMNATNFTGVDAVFGYDAMGRVNTYGQCAPVGCNNGTRFVTNYTYDHIGDVLNGNNILNNFAWTNTYNQIGQLTQVYTTELTSTSSGDLVSGITYNALGEATSDSLGNGEQESWTYSVDGVPTNYSVGSGSSSVFYWNLTVNTGVISASNDNQYAGNVYTYDDFDRLATMKGANGQGWGFSYGYDQYGNRWNQTVTQGSGPSPSYAFSSGTIANTNHIITGVTYDDAGNMTYDGSYYYKYDGNNKIIAVGTTSGGNNVASYAYNSRGMRVSTTSSGSTVEWMFDLAGNALTASVPGTTQFYEAEYFVGGRDWGTLSTGGVNFRYPDWVGNGRVWQDVSGTVTQQAAYAAFGDGLFAPGGGSCCALGAGMFDSAWRDSGSNTYHTMNREYSPTQGRWLTPDPAGLAAVDPSNPQTWNRYAYVTNNPVSNTDPTGLCDDGSGDDGSGDCGGDGSGGNGGGDGSGGGPGGGDPGGPVSSEPVSGAAEPPPGDCSGLCGVSGDGSSLGSDSFGIVSPTNDLGPGDVVGMDLSYNASWTGFGAQGSSGNFWDFCGNGCTSALGWASNFSAGAGDALTFGLTSVVNHITGAGALINRKSGAYWGGAATGAVVGIGLSGPEGPMFGGPKFKAFGYEGPGLLNRFDPLRVGWSWMRGGQFYRFRIGGTTLGPLVKYGLLSSPHINLWPPSLWGW
jgi:RHS repeat-associated protein